MAWETGLPELGRAADESAAAPPGENSCVSFKFLMEINTLSPQCITQSGEMLCAGEGDEALNRSSDKSLP